MPNLIAGLNALFVSGGAEKEKRSNATKHAGRLIEEWPRRGMERSSKKEPPSSINVPEQHYSVPLREDKGGRRLRRNSAGSAHDETSCAPTSDSTLFNSLNSAAMDASCYSLNDIMSSNGSSAGNGSVTTRDSINTAPDLPPRGVSRRAERPSRTRGKSISSSSAASRTSRKKTKRVRFTEEAPSLHRYVPLAPNQHYSSDDDDYFRQYTLTLARGVVRLLKTDAVNDETFDVLTGLPSAHCLRRYLNHPDIPAEEVVGMEDLLAGSGIASARKRLKNVQTKKLLSEQRRQFQLGISDPTLIAKSLRKTSSISSNIARCRAAYAAGISD